MAEQGSDVNPYRYFSVKEALKFWKHADLKTWSSMVMFVLSSITVYLIFERLFNTIFSSTTEWGNGWYILAFYLAFTFLYIPSMPKTFKVYIRGKVRQDITEDEVEKGLGDYGLRSLDLYSIAFLVISIAGIVIYNLGKFLMLPDTATIVLLAAAVFDVFLITTLRIPRRGYGWGRLSKILTEEGYARYAGYKIHVRKVLAIFNVLAGMLLTYAILGKPSMWLTIILLFTILVNVMLFWYLTYYKSLKGAEEAERKAFIPIIELSITVLIACDMALAAWFIMQNVWPGIPKITVIFLLIIVFLAGMLTLPVVRFVRTMAGRIMRSKELLSR